MSNPYSNYELSNAEWCNVVTLLSFEFLTDAWDKLQLTVNATQSEALIACARCAFHEYRDNAENEIFIDWTPERLEFVMHNFIHKLAASTDQVFTNYVIFQCYKAFVRLSHVGSLLDGWRYRLLVIHHSSDDNPELSELVSTMGSQTLGRLRAQLPLLFDCNLVSLPPSSQELSEPDLSLLSILGENLSNPAALALLINRINRHSLAEWWKNSLATELRREEVDILVSWLERSKPRGSSCDFPLSEYPAARRILELS